MGLQLPREDASAGKERPWLESSLASVSGSLQGSQLQTQALQKARLGSSWEGSKRTLRGAGAETSEGGA
ncbi:hypothetical protein JRQ81_010393 [Phrynocephalus forsythii]|uniref:Uncharacterized protein n=1 Tax=Phrynocephalus forsythii TaxID=171643 RepID=A0A9Q1ARK6_9SAUR|nr:hypothetical protein JRQ81_010393 [Phrynocephalus forsythii]